MIACFTFTLTNVTYPACHRHVGLAYPAYLGQHPESGVLR